MIGGTGDPGPEIPQTMEVFSLLFLSAAAVNVHGSGVLGATATAGPLVGAAQRVKDLLDGGAAAPGARSWCHTILQHVKAIVVGSGRFRLFRCRKRKVRGARCRGCRRSFGRFLSSASSSSRSRARGEGRENPLGTGLGAEGSEDVVVS